MRVWRGITVVVMVCGAWMAGRAGGEEKGKLPFTVSKETTGIVSPLREDGTVDYVGALNEKYGKGVTKENNAFVAWLELVGTGDEILSAEGRDRMVALCGAKAGSEIKYLAYAEYLKQRGLDVDAVSRALGDEGRARARLWSAQDFPLLAKYLVEMEPVLEGAKKAFARPRFWAPYVASDGRAMVTVVASWREAIRHVGEALVERAMLRAKSDDMEGFVSDMLAAKRIANHLGSSGTVHERLHGMAVELAADQALGAVVGRGFLPEKQLTTLATALDELKGMRPLWEIEDVTERWSWMDDVLLLASGHPEPLSFNESYKEKWASVDCDLVDWDVVLKHVNKLADMEVEALKKPWIEEARAGLIDWVTHRKEAMTEVKERMFARKPEESREAYSEHVAGGIVAMLSVDWLREMLRDREALMQEEMARAVVAAARYRAEKGHWPEKLADLVPGYLKAVPKDIYSEGGNKEIKYMWSGDGAVVSSIGRAFTTQWDQKGGVIEVGAK